MKTNINLLSDLDLVKMAQEGSSTALEYILRKYKPLVRSKSANYFLNGGDHDDVLQEAMIGLYKAVRDFDMNKSTSFSSFASLCINRQLLSAVTFANRQKHKMLNDSLSIDGKEEGMDNTVNDDNLLDKGATPEEVAILREALEQVSDTQNTLFSNLEFQVWQGLLAGKSVDKMAKDFCVEQKSIYNAVGRIRKKLTQIIID